MKKDMRKIGVHLEVEVGTPGKNGLSFRQINGLFPNRSAAHSYANFNWPGQRHRVAGVRIDSTPLEFETRKDEKGRQ